MNETKKLNILWTTDSVLTSKYMVLMYAKNSVLRAWWEEVNVIIWGASAKLVSENAEVMEEIKLAQNVGVKFSACVACARQLGVEGKLEAEGIEIKPWGEPLTEILESGEKLITI